MNFLRLLVFFLLSFFHKSFALRPNKSDDSALLIQKRVFFNDMIDWVSDRIDPYTKTNTINGISAKSEQTDQEIVNMLINLPGLRIPYSPTKTYLRSKFN